MVSLGFKTQIINPDIISKRRLEEMSEHRAVNFPPRDPNETRY